MTNDTNLTNGRASEIVVTKSRSESQIHQNNHSNNTNSLRIFIDDISTCEGSPGDRVWALSSGIEDSLQIHFFCDDDESSFREHAIDIVLKNGLIMFTVPQLKIGEAEVQLEFSVSDENSTTIPFKYIPRIPRSTSSDAYLFDNLVDFATNGDPVALLHPFVSQISKTDEEGNTVLHTSSKSSQSFSLKMILSVISSEQKEEILNLQNKHGLTALHCAIRAGDPDAVHYLMNHGAKIDIPDGHGNTVLHYLADAYNESIFKEILEPSRGQKFDINQLNSDGFAPLHVAVRRLKLSLIEMLIDDGALIDLLDRDKKRNALMHAVEMNDFEAIQLLVERGSDTNIEDASNDTALSLAVKNVNYPVIGLLLDNKADPHRQNGKGVSLSDSDDEIIQNIINGERPELPKKDGFTIPNDLAASRSPLFGRSHPDNAPNEETPRNRLVKRSREEILNDAQSLLEEPETPASLRTAVYEHVLEDQPGPSTSSGRTRSIAQSAMSSSLKDNICNLDYLTRIRVAKIFDAQAKWQTLAQVLQCEHMIELISICSAGDDSSPTMILLDQYEQLSDSSITKLRDAMNEMKEEEGVKLIDQRYVY